MIASPATPDHRYRSALPFVRVWAAMLARRHRALDLLPDLICYGTIGLLDAARRYDPAHSVPFKAYAWIRVTGAILDGLRELAIVPRRHRDRGVIVVSQEDIDPPSEVDLASPPDDVAAASEARRQILAACDELDPRARALIEAPLLRRRGFRRHRGGYRHQQELGFAPAEGATSVSRRRQTSVESLEENMFGDKRLPQKSAMERDP